MPFAGIWTKAQVALAVHTGVMQSQGAVGQTPLFFKDASLGWIQVAPYLDSLQDSFVWHRCGQRLSGLNVHPANHREGTTPDAVVSRLEHHSDRPRDFNSYSPFQLTAPVSDLIFER